MSAATYHRWLGTLYIVLGCLLLLLPDGSEAIGVMMIIGVVMIMGGTLILQAESVALGEGRS